jgi:hypothetical protein
MVKPDVREHFDLRYVSTSRGNLYWKPRKIDCDAFGFARSYPLGRDGVEAWRKADRLNKSLERARAGEDPLPLSRTYRPGTFGSFYTKFTDPDWSENWMQLDPRGREDYFRAWPRIEAYVDIDGIALCDKLITQITPQLSERLHVDLHPAHDPSTRDPKGERRLSWSEAHRTLKVYRTLVTALVEYKFIPPEPPIGRIPNPEPKGRSEVWLDEEVRLKAEVACWGGQLGMAIAIRLAWDAMLSPVDVWALPLSGWIYRPGGSEINTARAKTDKPVYAAVSDEVAELVEGYLERLREAGADMNPDLPLVRRRSRVGDRRSANKVAYAWLPFTDRNHFGKVYRPIRAAAGFAADRKFLDIRRSAMTEARMGGATKDDLGKAAANRVDANPKLEATYLHGASRNVLETRSKGRGQMAAKFRKDG